MKTKVFDNVNPEDLIQISLPEWDNKFPNPDELLFYNDLQNRILYLTDDIKEDIMNITKYILMFNKEDRGKTTEERKPIKILIYSYGGDINVMQHIIDIITISKTPVYTYNIGVCMSAGFDILLAGHKRFALPNSQVLIHEGSATFGGNANIVDAQAAQYKKQRERFTEYLFSRTKITKALYAKKKKDDWFVDGNDLIELGIIDAFVSDIEELL